MLALDKLARTCPGEAFLVVNAGVAAAAGSINIPDTGSEFEATEVLMTGRDFEVLRCVPRIPASREQVHVGPATLFA